MRLTICLIAALALVPAATPVGAKAAAKPAAFDINHTTWTFTEKGKAYRESIDESGNYVTHMGGKEVDHGSAVMKDGKACFTSAVDKEGEECWTTRPVAVGHSMTTHNDKGRKLTVHRVAYVGMKTTK
ncbi:hypothetical protein [Sphingomonas sp.]|uniref:hypothetical protein n=1 Tax=Sphingomonas sp. TaxID=28214 RepID=UPI0025E81345|nr:hypothetical protein [Sphingomonas sp.]MBV9528681.1 hypothetical protein [Sphingomonas sp.]